MSDKRNSTKSIAFGALMAALGTVIMLTGGLIPVFTYCSPIIAALLLIPVLDQYGNTAAWLVWGVTSILSLIIGVDKEASFFYLFFAWYPIAKPYFDRIRPRILSTGAKVLAFSACTFAMYYLTCSVLGIEEIVSSFSPVRWLNALFFALLVVCMLVFDKVLERMKYLYLTRLKTRLFK